MGYYKQKQYLAEVDRKGNVVGKVEKWHAHKNGVLHRGFTVMAMYRKLIVCQQRKHPVFDGHLDLTFSSHPVYIKDKLRSETDVIKKSFIREWNVNSKSLGKVKLLGRVYYKTKDGKYTEHEDCALYMAKVTQLPKPNFDYSYGFSLLEIGDLKSQKPIIKNSLAPWVKAFLKEGLI